MTSQLDCQTAVTHLWPFLERALSAAGHRAVQHHLAFCPACSDELSRIRATLVLLQPGLPPALPPAAQQRLEETIDHLTGAPHQASARQRTAFAPDAGSNRQRGGDQFSSPRQSRILSAAHGFDIPGARPWDRRALADCHRVPGATCRSLRPADPGPAPVEARCERQRSVVVSEAISGSRSLASTPLPVRRANVSQAARVSPSRRCA